MQKITPFLWFDNEAEEAAKFYVSIFRNSKIVVKITRHGDAGPRPKGTVMTVDFRDAQAAEHIEQNISVYLRAF